MHNLFDEVPWITGSRLDGAPFALTLKDTFLQCEDLAMVSTSNPIQTAAILRLMCAAVIAADQGDSDSIKLDSVVARLSQYRDRFALSDSPDPFMQVPITDCEPRSIAQLDPMRASGGDHTLWDHRQVNDPLSIDAAEAARQLVSLQAGGTGGVQKGPHAAGSKTGDRSGPKGTITRNATMFLIGRNLAETLAMACTGVARIDGDRPCWERPTPSKLKQYRDPTGPCDWLTWQPRRIFLTVDGSGRYDGCIIRPGYVHADDFDVIDSGFDPHIAARATDVLEFEPAGSNWLTPQRAQGLYTGVEYGYEAAVFDCIDTKGRPKMKVIKADSDTRVTKTLQDLTEKYGTDNVSVRYCVANGKDTLFPGLAADVYGQYHPGTDVKMVVFRRGSNLAKYTGDSMFYTTVTTTAAAAKADVGGVIIDETDTHNNDDEPQDAHFQDIATTPTLF